MRSLRAFVRPPAARGFAVSWTVLGLAGAAMLTVRAWNALVGGQLQFPLPFGRSGPVSRTAEPLLFHFGLLLSLLLALACLYAVYGAWQYRAGARSGQSPSGPGL